jgi:uncharacterized YccA/Bax inhibitor family protein
VLALIAGFFLFIVSFLFSDFKEQQANKKGGKKVEEKQ